MARIIRLPCGHTVTVPFFCKIQLPGQDSRFNRSGSMQGADILQKTGQIGTDKIRSAMKTEETSMEIKKKNTNIRCSVTQCKHNMLSENYCGLDCICVGTHEQNPTVPECTNCDSFVKRSSTQG